MIVNELRLSFFKNYKKLDVAFHPKLNLFVGQNGMGKTNLMDAVHFTAFCKSNFQRQDVKIATHNESFYRIESNLLSDKAQPIDFKAIVELGKGKRISLNQVEYDRISHHLGLLPLIFIGPNDIYTLLQGSEERRKLLDSCICQVDKNYTTKLIEYTQLLKQRNAYLKSLDRPDHVDMTLLDSFDTQMEGRANLIYEVRNSFVSELSPQFSTVYQGISNGAEESALSYKSQLSTSTFIELCKSNLKKDLILKRTSTGIHKDDIDLLLDDRSLKTFASQGQLKSFVLALKISQYEYLQKICAETPILLLDDIFDKLDRTRVKNLIVYLIEKEKGQIFITDTNQDRVSSILEELKVSHRVFIIEDGAVKSTYEK